MLRLMRESRLKPGELIYILHTQVNRNPGVPGTPYLIVQAETLPRVQVAQCTVTKVLPLQFLCSKECLPLQVCIDCAIIIRHCCQAEI